jgi:hypothetical protein
MAQLTIRQTSAELPGFDPEIALEPLPRLSADSRLLADFRFGDVTSDALELGSYRRCDLRGNDLSAVVGAAHLKHVILDRVQTMQLGHALAEELAVTFGDEAPSPP